MIRHRRTLKHTAPVLTLAFAAFGLGACDSDTAAPEQQMQAEQGNVSAMVSDNPSSGGQAASGSGRRAFEGSFSGTVATEIYSETDGWVAIGSPASASLDLQSSDSSQVAASASVPADTYTRIRFTMSGGSASINAGAVLGGVLLAADVNVVMGGSDNMVVIEKTVTPFAVSASSSASLMLDLNSEVWINSTSTQAEAATDAEIQAATAAFVAVQ